MSQTQTILISAEGWLTFLWDDRLAELLGEGDGKIRRASHVEPTSAGQWTADLSPCGGPVLGPFGLRDEALAAERDWLERRLTRKESSHVEDQQGARPLGNRGDGALG